MWWLSWRQHRAGALTGALLLAVMTTLLITTGLTMHDAYRSDGIAACLPGASAAAGCQSLIDSFTARFTGLNDLLPWLVIVPALIGMFYGAPMIGREFDLGTWKLVWAQDISRRRWFLIRLAIPTAAVLALAATFTALFAWWRQPLDAIQGRFDPTAFDLAGPSFAASALFALSLGVLAGALVRATMPAMALTALGYIAVRVPIEIFARPRYLTPLTRTIDPVAHDKTTGPAITHDWILHTGWIDNHGHHLTDAAKHRLIAQAASAGTDLARYLQAHGIANYVTYQPASRYWTFQAIESGILLGLAAILLAIAYQLVTHGGAAPTIMRRHRTRPAP